MTEELRRRKARRLQIARGLDVTHADADEVRAILQHWLDEGWRPEAIARASGVTPPAACALIRGDTRTVKRPVAERLATVTRARLYASSEGHDLVPAVGIQRRLQALQTLGWTWGHMQARGVVVRSCWLHPGFAATAGAWHSVRDLYDQLWDTPGPSALTRARAARKGYAPPAAWDDDTIDDPRAAPDLGDTAHRDDALVEDLQWFLRTGVGWQAALVRLDRSDQGLDRKLRRIGRGDLVGALKAIDRREAS